MHAKTRWEHDVESLTDTAQSEEKTMADTPVVRFVSYDRDPDSRALTVSDIRETVAPARMEGGRSYTALSKDERRRELLVAFAIEVDRMIAGEIDEFSVSLVMTDTSDPVRA